MASPRAFLPFRCGNVRLGAMIYLVGGGGGGVTGAVRV